MNFSEIIFVWLLFSLYRLWQPVVAAVGFSSPVTLAIIFTHNMLSVSYLLLITAIGYLALQRKSWIITLAISLTWVAIGLLALEAYSLRYGLIAAFSALFPHAWLELSAIFYWVYWLQRACRNYYISFQNDWSSWKDLLQSAKNPRKLFRVIHKDAEKARNLTIQIFSGLWSQNLKRHMLLVAILIFISAAIETYVTPTISMSFQA